MSTNISKDKFQISALFKASNSHSVGSLSISSYLAQGKRVTALKTLQLVLAPIDTVFSVIWSATSPSITKTTAFAGA